MLILGIFGSSKKQGFLNEAGEEATRQMEIEQIKARKLFLLRVCSFEVVLVLFFLAWQYIH